jgi:hypothetical protein
VRSGVTNQRETTVLLFVGDAVLSVPELVRRYAALEDWNGETPCGGTTSALRATPMRRNVAYGGELDAPCGGILRRGDPAWSPASQGATGGQRGEVYVLPLDKMGYMCKNAIKGERA